MDRSALHRRAMSVFLAAQHSDACNMSLWIQALKRKPLRGREIHFEVSSSRQQFSEFIPRTTYTCYNGSITATSSTDGISEITKVIHHIQIIVANPKFRHWPCIDRPSSSQASSTDEIWVFNKTAPDTRTSMVNPVIAYRAENTVYVCTHPTDSARITT